MLHRECLSSFVLFNSQALCPANRLRNKAPQSNEADSCANC
jgi:hypothetical protein